MRATGMRLAACCGMVALGIGMLRALRAIGEDRPPVASHVLSKGYLRLELISGRVAVTAQRHADYRPQSVNGKPVEKLHVNQAGGTLQVTFELPIPRGLLSLKTGPGGRIHIRRAPLDDSPDPPVELLQEPNSQLSLSIGPPGQQSVYRTKSVWHLLIAEPEVCRRYVIPLLDTFSPKSSLLQIADELEEELLHVATVHELPDRGQSEALVRQLSAEHFSQREAADRQLRSSGRTVLTYLEQLDPRELDAEQQFRIRRIIMALSRTSGADTAGQLASWLAGDPAIWLLLLSHQELATRQLAAQQLATPLGGPISFDPTADATAREAQVEQLRVRIRGD